MRYDVALVHKEDDSDFGVSFPDFPGCVSAGSTLAEAAAAHLKVSPNPRIAKDRMGSYAITPFEHKAGVRLSGAEAQWLERWIALNQHVIEGHWDGVIEYTEDALAHLRAL